MKIGNFSFKPWGRYTAGACTGPILLTNLRFFRGKSGTGLFLEHLKTSAPSELILK